MANAYVKLQNHVSRGSVILSVLMIMMFIAVAGCSDGGDPQADAATAASQDFMKTYYQQNSAKNGLNFTTGDAKVKVAKEVAAIEKSGVSPDSAGQKPTVTLKLDATKKLNDHQFRVAWTVQSSAGQTINVATTMVKPSDRWLVAKFVESNK